MLTHNTHVLVDRISRTSSKIRRSAVGRSSQRVTCTGDLVYIYSTAITEEQCHSNQGIQACHCHLKSNRHSQRHQRVQKDEWDTYETHVYGKTA